MFTQLFLEINFVWSLFFYAGMRHVYYSFHPDGLKAFREDAIDPVPYISRTTKGMLLLFFTYGFTNLSASSRDTNWPLNFTYPSSSGQDVRGRRVTRNPAVKYSPGLCFFFRLSTHGTKGGRPCTFQRLPSGVSWSGSLLKKRKQVLNVRHLAGRCLRLSSFLGLRSVDCPGK